MSGHDLGANSGSNLVTHSRSNIACSLPKPIWFARGPRCLMDLLGLGLLVLCVCLFFIELVKKYTGNRRMNTDTQLLAMQSPTFLGPSVAFE